MLIFIYRQETVANLTMSVFGNLNEHSRQLLGSVEIDVTMFYGTSENVYGMRRVYAHLRRLKDCMNRDTASVP
jgi:hypothetical protein